jgi:hypothetical protein
MRRRIVESAVLSLVWLGPLLVAPGALLSALAAGGPLAPLFLVLAGVFVGARRGPRRGVVPLLATASVAALWALSARVPSGGPEESAEIAVYTLSLLGCWVLVCPLARTLEPVDALESRFLFTLVADATAILASVSLAVLFDLQVALGGALAIAVALLAVRYPVTRVRAGITVLAGGLLHAWLGLPGLLELAGDRAAAGMEMADVMRRSAVLASAAVLAAIVLSANEEKPRTAP